MVKIGLPKGSGKRLKVREKSGNCEMDIEWQPCISHGLHERATVKLPADNIFSRHKIRLGVLCTLN